MIQEEKCIYLDYNATTPFAPEVVAAMRPILEEGACFGNPSSAHRYGREAHAALERARAQIAALLDCDVDEVVLTSGGTESNNTALTCCRPAHVVTSAVEHPAVRAVCDALAAGPLHTAVHVVPVDGAGLVDAAAVARTLAAIRAAEARAGQPPATVLVSVMHANNEFGAVQPIAAIAAAAHAHGALMHTDAAQSAGKIDVRVRRLGVDLLSLAAHKLYGPKGVGALYVRRGADALRGHTLLHGAGHEHGRRPGTENVLGATGLGAACALARTHLVAYATHMAAVRNALLAALVAGGMGPDRMRVNGPLSLLPLPASSSGDDEKEAFDVCETQMLPNTLSVSFRGISAPALLAAVGDRVAASAGAACHSGGADAARAVSATLRAMDVPLEWALGTVRLSVGRETTLADVQEAARCIVDAVNSLQAKVHTA